jgi:hypothetical protein
MTRTMVSFVLAAALSLPAVAGAKPVKAGASGPTACNLKTLPLAVDNTWTYKSGAQQVVIKVLEVGPGKDFAGKPATVATLEENLNGVAIKTTVTCTPQTGMQVPLESFFFTGEPGGGVGTVFTVTARDRATWLPDDQVIDGNGWVEVVKADATRTDMGGAGAVHAPAQVEVERHVNVKPNEKLMIGLGEFNTQRVVFELRGRGIIDEERSEIPIKRPGQVWLQKGVGYIKVDDAFDKTWELVDTNLVAK